MTINSSFALCLLAFTLFGMTPQGVKKQSPSKQAKDPCDSELTQLELDKCYGDQYRKADAHLNALYQKVMHLLEAQLKNAQDRQDEDASKLSQTAIQKLEATEKAWISYRDLQCDAAKFEYEGSSVNPMIWAICMKTVTEHRISDLKDAYETPERKLE
jgi:uncharacterized protein YecT (DUF1311 family)